MEIKINGENKNIAEKTSILDIVNLQNLNTTMFAVERNLKIVPKSEYASTILSDGDNVEIVNFVGGG